MRYPLHGPAGQIFLFLIGIGWCLQAARQFPSDLQDFRATQRREVRLAIGVWWAFTGLVALATLASAPTILRRALDLLR